MLAFDPTDVAAVAWPENDGNLHVKQWMGGQWQAVGAPVNAVPGQGVTGPFSLAVSPQGAPLVAYVEQLGTNPAVFVEQYFR
jgi:hypothetical protein